MSNTSDPELADGGEMTDVTRCQIGYIGLPENSTLYDWLGGFADGYGSVHPYIATVICFVGIHLNLINIIVLSRPTMRNPVNVLLTAIAICDGTVMVSTLVFVVHFMIVSNHTCDYRNYSRPWVLFQLVHAHSSVIFHSTSLWITVMLAQIRVLTIGRATIVGQRAMMTQGLAFGVCLACFMLVCVVNIPNFMSFEIEKYLAHPVDSCEPIAPVENDSEALPILLELLGANYTGVSSAKFIYSVKANKEDCVLLNLTFWSNGLAFKLLPCVLLSLFIGVLVRLVNKLRTKRKSLALIMRRRSLPVDHTTPMLIAVVAIFLAAELPQGFMLVLTAVFKSDQFRHKIYYPLGDLMDLLSLLNSSVNFLIYCAMSRQFRRVFEQLIPIWCLPESERLACAANRRAMGPGAESRDWATYMDTRRPSDIPVPAQLLLRGTMAPANSRLSLKNRIVLRARSLRSQSLQTNAEMQKDEGAPLGAYKSCRLAPPPAGGRVRRYRQDQRQQQKSPRLLLSIPSLAETSLEEDEQQSGSFLLKETAVESKASAELQQKQSVSSAASGAMVEPSSEGAHTRMLRRKREAKLKNGAAQLEKYWQEKVITPSKLKTMSLREVRRNEDEQLTGLERTRTKTATSTRWRPAHTQRRFTELV